MTTIGKTLNTRLALVFMLVFAVALVAACGGDNDAGDAVAADAEGQHDDGDEHADDAANDAEEHADADADAHEDDGDAHEEEGGALAVEADLVLDLELKDFAFGPDKMTIHAGEVVHFNAENTTNNIHDFTIDKVDADIHIVSLPGTGEHAHMDGPMADLHFAFTEKGRGAIQIRVHEPGEYVYYCSVPGHREAGMVGTLIVEEAADHDDGDDHG